jgi:hypothetical protein
MTWKNSMQVVQTAALPPNHGNMNLPISGCTWKSRNELINVAAQNTNSASRVFDDGGDREGLVA